MRKDFITEYIVKNCIAEAPMKEFMLGKLPGSRYSHQYYLAPMLYDQAAQADITVLFRQLVRENVGHWNFQLAGREWSAVPLLTFLPILLNQYHDIEINSFMIRRQRKNYGQHNWVEGKPNKLPVLLVDDLCNSTDSYLHNFRVCTNVLKLDVMDHIFAVLNKYKPSQFQEQTYHDRYLIHDHPHKALYIVDGDEIQNARNIAPKPPEAI